jgi:UDP-glucuronate 4-epimerase
MSKETILVTGGAGFIGSHLIGQLLAEGHRVINLDDFNAFYDPQVKHQNVAAFPATGAYHEYTVDIRDKATLAKVFTDWGSEIKQVVHLAARAGVRPSLEDPELYLETNVMGTHHILELMKLYCIPKLVFASSSSVYGSRSNPPFKETDDVSQPISPYAATKVMGENLIYTYSHLYGIQSTCLRFFTVYGPGQRPDLAIHKFAKLIDSGRAIPVFGDGSSLRDFTYIDDILQGIRGAMEYTKTPFEVFNLGESEPVSLAHLIGYLEQAMQKTAIIERLPLQAGDVPMTCADISKARALLNYSPQTSITKGLDFFLDWFYQVYHAKV